MKIGKKQILALGFGLWALGFGLWAPEVGADEGYRIVSFYNGISVVAVDSRFGLSETKDSALRARMASLLINSKILNRDNIKNIAVAYLSKNLKRKLHIVTWNPNPPDSVFDASAVIIRFDYSVWEREINGKKVIICSIVSHALRTSKQNLSYLLTDNETLDVDSFVVDQDQKALQGDLESTIHRMLDRYIHSIDG